MVQLPQAQPEKPFLTPCKTPVEIGMYLTLLSVKTKNDYYETSNRKNGEEGKRDRNVSHDVDHNDDIIIPDILGRQLLRIGEQPGLNFIKIKDCCCCANGC